MRNAREGIHLQVYGCNLDYVNFAVTLPLVVFRTLPGHRHVSATLERAKSALTELGNMDLRHFDLALLPALDCLLREKNVTYAAKHLSVSQQALSGTLQRLRKYFDDELLIRVGRQFELTPLGQSLIVPTREALLAARAVVNAKPTFEPSDANVELKVAMSDYALLVLLPHIMNILETCAPGVKFMVKPVTRQCLHDLSMGELDLCIMTNDLSLFGIDAKDGRICSRILFEDDFVCVFDKRKNSFPGGITIENYRRLRHNRVSFDEDIMTIVEKAWLKDGGEFEAASEASTFSSLLFMLPGTSMVATTQRRLATALAPRLKLSVTECPLKIPNLLESMIWHERNNHDPAHRFLRETVASAAGALVDADRLSTSKSCST